jgi:CHAT domain-containing protein
MDSAKNQATDDQGARRKHSRYLTVLPRQWRALSRRSRLTIVGLVSAAAAAIWISISISRVDSVERLLAQAYTEHRTIEIRIPGARYSPLHVERGDDQSNLNGSAAFLEAAAMVRRHLDKVRNEPKWLQAKARIDLLDGKYGPAIESLSKALETQPGSPQLLTDLGSAYFLRGKSVERAIDMGSAVEFFGQALVKAPDDQVALFNRALACERLSLYTQAADDWNHYLQIDPRGGWAEEARKRLSAVQERLEDRKQTLLEPLLSARQIAEAKTSNPILIKQIDWRIEDYLKLAITDWLPAAYGASERPKSHEARIALAELSLITQDLHQDHWLTELLSNAGARQFESAIEALANAVRANEKGDYSQGRNFAHAAAQLFSTAGNRAGQLRAQAEEVYSNHLLWEGHQCLELLAHVDAALRPTSYAWLKAQMALERSNCADLVGDEGTYQTAISVGEREAEAHTYWSLFLRALGFQSLGVNSMGDARAAFSLASRGLKRFWDGQGDLMKGYNLYTDLDAAADGLHLPYLQVAVWHEATALIDQHPDVLLRAMAHRWYGNAAYLAKMPDLAELEFSRASELFAASPKTVATIRDRMDAEIWLAQIEVRQGDIERAAGRLQDIKPTLDSAPSFGPEIGFYSAQAEIGMRRGDLVNTQAALQSAIFLAEWALKSFPSEKDRHEWAEQTRPAYRNAVEWTFRQGDAAAALELWEWYRGAESRADEGRSQRLSDNLNTSKPPKADDAPLLPSPTAVMNSLPLLQDETVITYATFSDGIAVWAYDDRGLVSRWIPISLSDLQDLSLKFQRLCSDPTSDLTILRATAHALYNALMAPLEELLISGRTVVIEPDDSLAMVAWEALVDSKGRYAAERFPIVLSPGVYRSSRLHPKSPINDQTPALVVSVPLVDGFTPLMDAENEARSVVARFSHARWLQGSNATSSRIRDEMSDAEIFHFAGHAMASPLRGGLILEEMDPRTHNARLISPDSLNPRQTARLQLAVLSACDTGVDERPSGSVTDSLVRKLVYSGVPQVVASRWNVDSSKTAELMKQFYARLLAGSDVATSLQGAEIALASQAASAHPYYWAAFALHGVK